MDIISQLKRDEGTKRDSAGFHIAYYCTAGKLTIGYGHNLAANPVPGVSRDSRLTEDQAERLLAADVEAVEAALRKHLPWAARLDDPRRGVLVNMAFNMGIAGLLTFTNTLKLVQNGKYVEAARNMLQSKWARQVGMRALRLSLQMERGEWQ